MGWTSGGLVISKFRVSERLQGGSVSEEGQKGNCDKVIAALRIKSGNQTQRSELKVISLCHTTSCSHSDASES